MGLGQYISNTVLLDLWQLCEIDEKQYNIGPVDQAASGEHKEVETGNKDNGIF